MEYLIGIVLLVAVLGFFLWRYKSKHPQGYAEHKQQADDIVEALTKPFDKESK